MQKNIHYCWFGNNKFPKLSEKCLKSWQTFLPDFKIIKWSEENSNFEDCVLVKKAFENKKWAFVSDYIRLKALYEYGGIYFDTDMEVIKNIDWLFEKDFVIGKEDSGYIAAGVIFVKEKHNKYIKEILDYYNSIEDFDINNLFDFSIPKIITKVLSKYESKMQNDGIEIIDGNIYAYPSEYFYPINYDFSKKVYTKNTCMVHYYNATWVPKSEKITITIYRKFGVKNGKKIISFLTFPKRVLRFIFRKIKSIFNFFKYRISRFYEIFFKSNERIKNIETELKKLSDFDYVAFHNKYWLGVSNSTKTLFKSTVSIEDVFRDKEAKKIADVICNEHKKLLIFSGFPKGYEKIIEYIRSKDKDVIIKVLWHGSNALLVEQADFNAFDCVLDLYNQKIINEIGFVKKSLYEFFKQKGYNVSFIMNYVDIDVNKLNLNKKNNNNGQLKFGLYASLDRWVKNTYNQISAISLFKNAKIDITPINNKLEIFAKKLGLDISLSSKINVSRDEILSRMSKNDVNVYVTFTECSPMIPLESLEVGVPCVTGDNHHYFEDTKLEEFLVVKKEDNIMAIYDKINKCLDNKNVILELYKEWKEEYIVKAKKSVEDFLKLS